MPGKIFGVSNNSSVVQLSSFRKDLQAFAHLEYRSLKPTNRERILNFLSYKQGDLELIRDSKDLVVRRIACEALSRNDLEIYGKFSELLKGFPLVPLMKDYMVPKEHKLGEAGKIVETCRPLSGDSPLILRAKREALLFNLMAMIEDLCIEIAGVVNYRTNKSDFKFYYSWVVDLVREHLPYMPEVFRQLTEIHVLNPEFPFNIKLPD